MNWVNRFFLIVSLSILAACVADDHRPQQQSSYPPSQRQPLSLRCNEWKKQQQQCEIYNQHFSGMEKGRKVDACMSTRGFPDSKEKYCPR